MPWAQRVVSAGISGFLMQLHYIASDVDAQGIPSVPAPTGPESDTERAQREELSALMGAAHVATADWSPQVADEMRHILPTDAVHVVEAITDIARGWWEDSGYTAAAHEHQAAMETQLDGLVPPARRDSVQHVVEMVASEPDVDVTRARYRLIGTADSRPFEAIHVAAALGVALWRTPACVPEPLEAQYKLTQKLRRHLDGDLH